MADDTEQSDDTTEDASAEQSDDGGGAQLPSEADGLPEEAQKIINRYLRDNRQHRESRRQAEERLAEAMAKVKEHEEAGLSELERRDRRIAELEELEKSWQSKYTKLQIGTAVRDEASTLGFIDPQAAYRLLDDEAIEYDKAGEPKNIRQLLERLADSKPYLMAKAPSANGGDGRRSGPSPRSFNDDIRERLRKR
jgi:hypothetical protein